MKPTNVVLVLMLGAAFASARAQPAQQNAEQKVFGVQRSATAAPKQQTSETDGADKKKAASKPAENKERAKLKPREEAKLLYDRFNAGDMLYAAKLKDAANGGNQWASMQYGYLAHKGRLPGLKGPDYALAQRAYMKAVKTRDNALTGNYIAAYNLGVLYFNGGGSIKKDPAASLRWFQTAIQSYRELRKSKSAVFWPASAYAAQILTNGYGAKPDKAAARPYWLEAVKGNEPVTLYGYAKTIYSENPFAAIGYYRRAADRWHVPSMVALARWYAYADKFHQADPAQAASWLLRAAHYEPRHAQTAAAVMAGLNADGQKKAREAAAQWMRTRGVRQPPFDYISPLNDDPAPIR